MKLPVKALHPGLNCLVLLVQPTTYFESGPTVPLGFRVDLHNGDGPPTSQRCPVPEGSPDIRTTTRIPTLGETPVPNLSRFADKIVWPCRKTWSELSQGRVYVWVYDRLVEEDQEDAVFLMADGELLMRDDRPLLSVVRPQPGKEAIISFPLPRPSQPMVVAAVRAPLINRDVVQYDPTPAEAMPWTWWQMLVLP